MSMPLWLCPHLENVSKAFLELNGPSLEEILPFCQCKQGQFHCFLSPIHISLKVVLTFLKIANSGMRLQEYNAWFRGNLWALRWGHSHAHEAFCLLLQLIFLDNGLLHWATILVCSLLNEHGQNHQAEVLPQPPSIVRLKPVLGQYEGVISIILCIQTVSHPLQMQFSGTNWRHSCW